jgi:hypothetical protein
MMDVLFKHMFNVAFEMGTGCTAILLRFTAAALVLVGLLAGRTAVAQPKPGPTVNSPEVLSDARVFFRILAPRAESVSLQASEARVFPGLQRERWRTHLDKLAQLPE